jgi:putative DNA primase/helicase
VPEAVRIYRGNLIVPLIDIKTNADQIMNVQTIQPNGRKQFLKGAKVTGLCFPIGLINNNLNTLYIAEGFATAMTFHLVTEELVLSAMNAGNLMAVALSARKRWPQTRIIIVGDDDWLTEQETGINPGVTKATAAATAVDGFTCFPPFSADQHQRKLTDWNDYLFDRIQEPA